MPPAGRRLAACDIRPLRAPPSAGCGTGNAGHLRRGPAPALLSDGPVQRTARIDRPHRSPLLACVYLHRLDWAWRHGEDGVLVRYADDLVVMCRTRGQAEHALARLTWLLASLGLEPNRPRQRSCT